MKDVPTSDSHAVFVASSTVVSISMLKIIGDGDVHQPESPATGFYGDILEIVQLT